MAKASWRARNRKRLAAYGRAWRKRNRHRVRKYQQRWWAKRGPAVRRRHRLKTLYRTTPDAVEKLRKKQRGRCALCKKRRRLVIDHCHRTGRMRKLLCDECNGALGTVERVGLTAIAKYLRPRRRT